MNARITITVDYDSLPIEARSVLQRSLSRIDNVVECTEKAMAEDDLNKKLELIKKAREMLLLVDANLEDSYHIFLGYAKNELESKTQKDDNDNVTGN
jgi:hypothetical protein